MDTLSTKKAANVSWKIRPSRMLLMLCPALLMQATAAMAAPAAITVDFPLMENVGPLRAGRLCFPKGAVRGVDFVPDADQFGLLVRQAVAARAVKGKTRLGDGASIGIDLAFTTLSAELCAKSWGVMGFGDTKSLSGESNFTFQWRFVGEQENRRTIEVSIQTESKDRMTPPVIMRRAVDIALDQIDPG